LNIHEMCRYVNVKGQKEAVKEPVAEPETADVEVEGDVAEDEEVAEDAEVAEDEDGVEVVEEHSEL
jgi:hypothetical protein